MFEAMSPSQSNASVAGSVGGGAAAQGNPAITPNKARIPNTATACSRWLIFGNVADERFINEGRLNAQAICKQRLKSAAVNGPIVRHLQPINGLWNRRSSSTKEGVRKEVPISHSRLVLAPRLLLTSAFRAPHSNRAPPPLASPPHSPASPGPFGLGDHVPAALALAPKTSRQLPAMPQPEPAGRG